MKKYLLLIIFIIAGFYGFSQRITISGYISDKESGERLINANIYNKNTLQGTTANTYGFYSLSLPQGKIHLVASFVGYTQQEFEIDLQNDTTLHIYLTPETDQLKEVTVIGNRINKVEETQMSVIDVPIQKLKSIPVIMGEADVLKVIQLLPGVQSGTEGTSGIYVRGGGPDQNLFLLDGVPVYNASHLLGFFSVFNPDAIKTVKLYKGGFPSRFGGRLSSVVDISMKDGNMKEFKGDFSIGIISSKLMLEGPIVKDKTSFMISGRRTYLDILSKPIFMRINSMEDGAKVKGGAFFHDYNLKVNHIFNDRSRLYLSGYLGKDKGYGGFDETDEYRDDDNTLQKQKSSNLFSLSWGNRIASLRWNYLINKKLFSNTTLTYSKYIFDVKTEFVNEDLIKKEKISYVFRYYSGIRDWTAKIDFDYYPNPNHAIKFGSNYIYHTFSPGVLAINFESIDIDLESLDLADQFKNDEIDANEIDFFIEDEITINNNFNINAGVHLSVFMVEGVNYVRPQPRLSARYKATPNWALKASYSRMAQHVHLLTTSGISMPTDLWLPVTKKFEPPISDQVALGTAINLPKGINLTFEGFYKTMKNLIEYKEGASFMGSASNWETKVEKGDGWSYGAEVMLEKTLGKTTGWIGYTWSKTERLFDNLNFGNPFPAKYDRRHDISIALTHEFSENFDIGGSWVYGTGNAVTLAIMEYKPANIPNTETNNRNNIKQITSRNNYRMPAYHRMDIGMNFHKKRKRGIRTWSISVYNGYNRKNPFFLSWESDDGELTMIEEPKTQLIQFSLFPLIPSISYSFKF